MRANEVPALGFLRLIWRLNHAIEQRSKDMEATLGVTAQQRMVIRHIGSQPGVTAGQLAAQLHLDAGTVSATLGRLERRQLVTRARDRADRRRVIVKLTTDGRALDRSTIGTVEHAVERLLQQTKASRIAASRRVLVALTELLDQEGTR